MPRKKPYPSDLTNEEWAVLKPLVPRQKFGGRPASRPKRQIVNAILYILRNGGVWRALPHDYPPWQTVYYHFRQWRKDGLWAQINAILFPRVRLKAGRKALPTAAILDSQSVRTTEKGGSVDMMVRSA